MSQKIIRAALESRLKAWADAQSPVVPVAWQNVKFVPPAGRYIRAFLIPADTGVPTINREVLTFIGVFQVSICMPEGSGAAAAESMLDSLIAQFGHGVVISKSGIDVLVRNEPSAGPPIQESGLYIQPVSISYRADVTA